MRVLKFGSVGVANTLVDYAVFNAVLLGLGAPLVVSNVISYSVGIANSWFWNSRWTFADREMRGPRLALPTFVAINLAGLAINTVVVLVLRAAGSHLDMTSALPEIFLVNGYKAVAILFSLAWNYTATRRLVFT